MKNMMTSNKSKSFCIAVTIMIVIILIQIIALIVLLIGFNSNNNNDNQMVQDNNAVEWKGKQSIPSPTLDNSPAIEIPGFKEIYFIKDQTTQEVNFYNPEHNRCYFQMGLYSNNELLWKSGNILPGKGYYQIKLNKPFKKVETTDGYIKIRCFKKDGTKLNSATIKTKIIITNKEN